MLIQPTVHDLDVMGGNLLSSRRRHEVIETAVRRTTVTRPTLEGRWSLQAAIPAQSFFVNRARRRVPAVDERAQRVSDLLHEAGEVHHVVYRITDGADDDWASFYADWLIDHSELHETLGRAPTRSHLVHELVESERAFAEAAPAARWQDFYADRIVGRFG